MRISLGLSRSKISRWSSLLFSFFFVTILIIASSFSVMLIPRTYFYANAAYTKAVPAASGPTINDPNLKAELVFKGLKIPTSMAFLGPNNILVLEKNSGNVLRILDGNLIKKPLLHVNVPTQFLEWGLLGIAISKQTNPASDDNSGQVHTYVFLYYTKSTANPRVSAGNHLYRYELVNNQLINPVDLLNLPSNAPDPLVESNHDGGKVLIGPDNNVYTVIGDVGSHDGQAQNNKIGKKLDGTSGILRITKDGQPVVPNPLGREDPTRVYYAYGIRNSFGMDFDPVTGNLWDTENGPTYGDEINLVKPGFNSGWNQIMGVWQTNGPLPGPVVESPKDLINFGGKGIYRSPEFVWNQTVGPSALKFLNSDKIGKQYENTMFVGDVNTGNLYNFKLNEDRTGLLLSGALQGKVANSPDDLKPVIFGHGFGTITDLEAGPDGFLYVLTFDGTIYRIVPITG